MSRTRVGRVFRVGHGGHGGHRRRVGLVDTVPVALCVSALALLTACSSAPPVQRNALQAGAQTSAQSAARALARGDLAQARLLYERALASADAVEDFPLAGALLVNLALVHQRQAERENEPSARARELAAAQARVERIVAAPQRYGAAVQTAASLRRAMLHLDEGDTARADEWARRAESTCTTPCPHAATLAVLQAQVAWMRGDAAASAGHAERALAAARAAGQANEEANALRQRGRAKARLGRDAEAAADLAEALAIDQRLGLPERIALGLLWAGDVEHQRGRAEAAREFFERARVVYLAAGLTQGATLAADRLRTLTR